MPSRWRAIPKYRGLYEVSNSGQIRSVDRTICTAYGVTHLLSGKVLQPSTDHYGYPRVTLYRNNKRGYFNVHQLVLLAFIGPCPPGMECCHNDGDPTNNRLKNLRYGTPKANQADRHLHGTDTYGERHVLHKLTEKQVKRIFKLYASGKYTQQRLADKFGVSQPAVGYIVRGKCWAYLNL